MRKRIQTNEEACSGCRYCELVCSFSHTREFNPRFARIRIVKDDVIGMDIPVVCRQCRRCIPEENCPMEALERSYLGAVMVIEEKCVGCGQCITDCPFGSISWDPIHEIPLVCNLCDGEPICVRKCPTKALSYTDLNTISRKKGVQHASKQYKQLLSEWGADNMMEGF